MTDYMNMYKNCTLCPRNCHADRLSGKTGFCGESADLYVARAALHMWEEPCISGSEGSGAIFFSGCSMHCVFCQNYNIANARSGKKIDVNRLTEIFFELKEKGANNINLVTPTHYLPHIVQAIKKAKEQGFDLPFVYNTSGYERPESLGMLNGLVDVFLPDFKYYDSETALLFSKAKDYPEIAKASINKMVELAGEPEFDPTTGLIKKGVIVRVLVLPSHTNEAIKIVRYLNEKYADKIYISIMSQYTPLLDNIPKEKEYDCLRRRITKREYDKVVDAAIDMGVTNAFTQEMKVNLESFIPSFDNEGV